MITLAVFGMLQPGKSVCQSVNPVVQAQTNAPDKQAADCVGKDIRDLLKQGDKKKKPRKTMLLVFPNLSSNPANGLLLGLAGTAGFYLGPSENTKMSSAGFSAAVTTRNQLLTFFKSNIYTKDDKFFLQGDWRFLVYNAPRWGLGTNALDSIETDNHVIWQGASVDDVGGGFQMSYNYLKLHEIVNY